jgi:alpha/beta superfamily hydrolase
VSALASGIDKGLFVMRQAAIGFKSKKASLEGILTTPQGVQQPYPALVVCHAHPMLGGNMNTPLVTTICQHTDRLGIATLRFNFRGVEGSEGQFTNGDREQEDVKAALNVMKRWPGIDGKRLALAGYSFGGGLVLNGIKHYKTAHSLVMIAPPLSSLQSSRLKKDKRPKLFIVGQKDRIVSSLDLQRELDGVHEPVQFTEIRDADHSLRGHEQEAAERIIEFLTKNLG